LISPLERRLEQSPADSMALDIGVHAYEGEVVVRFTRVTLLERCEAVEERPRRAREHHADDSQLALGCSSRPRIRFAAVRRFPRRDTDELVTIMCGIDFAAREQFLENRTEERGKGDPASQAAIEKEGDDGVFSEGTCEQSTGTASLRRAESAHREIHVGTLRVLLTFRTTLKYRLRKPEQIAEAGVAAQGTIDRLTDSPMLLLCIRNPERSFQKRS
jgi:hypothetical protein